MIIPAARPLPDHLLSRLLTLLEADLSDVTFSISELPASLGVCAFACGSEIHLSADIEDSDWIIAHEAAHIVQQRRGMLDRFRNSQPCLVQDPQLELEADQIAFLATGRTMPRERPIAPAVMPIDLRLVAGAIQPFSPALASRARGTITPAVATVAPRANPARYGIRETLNLTHNIVAREPLGPLHWSIVSETASNQALYEAGGGGILTAVGGVGTARYQCPTYPSRVTLELRRQDESVLDRKALDVIMPDQATTYLLQFGTTHHVQNYCTAAFEAVVVLGPSDVCFSGLEMQEAYGAFTLVPGMPNNSMFTGVGNQHLVTGQHRNGAGNIVGVPQWVGFRNMIQQGSRMQGYDTIGNWGIYPLRGGWSNGPRQAWGRARWPIQWRWRIVGAAGTGVTFKYAEHEVWVYSDGDMELKKAGVELRTHLADATNHCHAWSGYQDPNDLLLPAWPVTAPPAPPA